MFHFGAEENRDAEVGVHGGLVFLRRKQRVAFNDMQAGLNLGTIHLGDELRGLRDHGFMVALAGTLHQSGELNLGGDGRLLGDVFLLEGIEETGRGGVVLESVKGVELDERGLGPQRARDVFHRLKEA